MVQQTGFAAYRNQMFAAVAATLGAFALGTVLGYTSPAMPSLRQEQADGTAGMDPFTEDTESWIGSIINLAALTAALIVGVLIDIIGRKKTMLLLSIPFIIGWILISFAKNAAMFIVARFFLGFSGGGFCVVAPLFIAEMAADSIRGALGSAFQVMITLGILFAYVLGTFVNWKTLAFVSLVIPIIFLGAMVFIPESPPFLVSKGRMSEVIKSLCWFRMKKNGKEVEDEMRSIQKSVDELKSQESSITDILVPHILRPSLLMITLMCFQQLSGINAVIFYTSDIFKSAGSSMNDNVAAIVVGVVQCIATITSIFLVDRAGRKILLLISAAFMCSSLVVLGIFFKLQKEGKADGLGWLPLLCLMIFMVAFSIGYGPIPFVMMGELIPERVKAKVASLAIVTNWLISFIVTKFFGQLQLAVGIYWCYWIFAIICGVNFIFVLTQLPETKGKSVEEIQQYFGAVSVEKKYNNGQSEIVYNLNNSKEQVA